LDAEHKALKIPSAIVLKLHKERLLDPKRGLYENPEEGVKGHHEMMLTTDICLVWKRGKKYIDCNKPINEFEIADAIDGHNVY